jgi:hypothetical protein
MAGGTVEAQGFSLRNRRTSIVGFSPSKDTGAKARDPLGH